MASDNDDDRILRIDEVLDLVGFSPSTLSREIDAERFPKPVAISTRRRGWRASEVRDWLARLRPVS